MIVADQCRIIQLSCLSSIQESTPSLILLVCCVLGDYDWLSYICWSHHTAGWLQTNTELSKSGQLSCLSSIWESTPSLIFLVCVLGDRRGHIVGLTRLVIVVDVTGRPLYVRGYGGHMEIFLRPEAWKVKKILSKFKLKISQRFWPIVIWFVIVILFASLRQKYYWQYGGMGCNSFQKIVERRALTCDDDD